MSTVAILVGFALMLFLPVVIAVMRVREQDDDLDALDAETGYGEELVETRVIARFHRSVLVEDVAPAGAASGLAAAGFAGGYDDDFEELESGDVSDPLAMGRGPRAESTRVERAEMDALQAQAVAARARANALAAMARAALARAEEADVEAELLEREAAVATEDVRRAA